MFSLLSVEGLSVVLAISALGVGMWRSRSQQGQRVSWLESSFDPPTLAGSLRGVAVMSLLPPQEKAQPKLQGVTLPGGLMCWEEPIDTAHALINILVARRRPTVLLSSDSGLTVLGLAREALNLGVDPRGRLVVASTVAELESTLDRFDLGCPWIVADKAEHLDQVVGLHRRFGCPVLLVNTPKASVGAEFVGLSAEARKA